MIRRILTRLRRRREEAMLLAGIEVRTAEWKRTKSTRRQNQLEREMQAMRREILSRGRA